MINGVDISFEFFPPKTPKGEHALLDAAAKLSAIDPQYFSVTFGAGGSTQDNTPKTVYAVKNATALNTAPHISCIDSNKKRIDAMLEDYKNNGVKQLVALRGDLPEGQDSTNAEFQYAADLVSHIRQTTGDHFDIHVAIYPESHPETTDPLQGLHYFKNKVNAGANHAITQYFYNVDAFERLLDNCAKLNINIPITPGIMPITNYKQLARFSKMCGAEIPRWIRLQCEAYDDDLESVRAFGEEVVTRLCERLIKLGVPGLHFYTLNKAEASSKIIEAL
ncbi:MAG: methylenetetrahydrofolate reductase [NAD(P)H] [Gammaproteobacteria bacterium]|nr:methylenetetrahydrofolate reductase [NAD(P)H] [Gammaproteobacteria bacterium]MCH9744547.1 methylenetetrahydrofolate reductase [NAD(P)H] [Gammaproteobacteria bacterium]